MSSIFLLTALALAFSLAWILFLFPVTICLNHTHTLRDNLNASFTGNFCLMSLARNNHSFFWKLEIRVPVGCWWDSPVNSGKPQMISCAHTPNSVWSLCVYSCKKLLSWILSQLPNLGLISVKCILKEKITGSNTVALNCESALLQMWPTEWERDCVIPAPLIRDLGRNQ